jgi:FkbM family methyltransferase
MALAAKCGSVYFFDPQPFCAQSIATAVIKNGFDRAFLVPYPVSDVKGKKIVLDKRYNCNGRWPIQQDEQGVSADTAITVETVTLQEVLPEVFSSIYIAKVDTEGGELAILHAMMPYILKKKVFRSTRCC